jgi:hypothetical protein
MLKIASSEIAALDLAPEGGSAAEAVPAACRRMPWQTRQSGTDPMMSGFARRTSSSRGRTTV